MAGRLLCISNGHGEDHEAQAVLVALRSAAPDIEVRAAPIVGHGAAYRAIGVPVMTPTKTMPTGGFFYLRHNAIWDDIRAGLVGLTLRQIIAVRRAARRADLVLAVGDVVAQAFAWASGRPYVSFLAPLSALYSGGINIDRPLALALNARRCRGIVTKDKASAENLKAQGLAGVSFGGWPAIDLLVEPSARKLDLPPGRPLVAIVPGSRPPEALNNLAVLLRVVETLHRDIGMPLSFALAAVPALRGELGKLAPDLGWRWDEAARLLTGPAPDGPVMHVPEDAFREILQASDVVVGSAGLGLEQAAIMGLPVVQFPGEGPQFTAKFAARQRALLGPGAQVVDGTGADRARLDASLGPIRRALTDEAYLRSCRENAESRFAARGASRRIAHVVLDALGSR